MTIRECARRRDSTFGTVRPGLSRSLKPGQRYIVDSEDRTIFMRVRMSLQPLPGGRTAQRLLRAEQRSTELGQVGRRDLRAAGPRHIRQIGGRGLPARATPCAAISIDQAFTLRYLWADPAASYTRPAESEALRVWEGRVTTSGLTLNPEVAEAKSAGPRWFEETDRGNLAIIDELVAGNYLDHNPPLPDLPSGREGVRPAIEVLRSAFLDAMHTIDNLIAEGDKVMTRVTTCATLVGECLGDQPTGKVVAISGIAVHRVADGKLVEHWAHADIAAFMRQIGADVGDLGQAVGEQPAQRRLNVLLVGCVAHPLARPDQHPPASGFEPRQVVLCVLAPHKCLLAVGRELFLSELANCLQHQMSVTSSSIWPCWLRICSARART